MLFKPNNYLIQKTYKEHGYNQSTIIINHFSKLYETKHLEELRQALYQDETTKYQYHLDKTYKRYLNLFKNLDKGEQSS